jgi:hypothetical protein
MLWHVPTPAHTHTHTGTHTHTRTHTPQTILHIDASNTCHSFQGFLDPFCVRAVIPLAGGLTTPLAGGPTTLAENAQHHLQREEQLSLLGAPHSPSPQLKDVPYIATCGTAAQLHEEFPLIQAITELGGQGTATAASCSGGAIGGALICVLSRVGQNRICTPYLTVCTVISLLKLPYVHRIYVEYMVLAHPSFVVEAMCHTRGAVSRATRCAFTIKQCVRQKGP